MAASPDRDVYFVFGSACRALAGKIPFKEWQHTMTAIWSWSLQTTRELNGTSPDVPNFDPPAGTTQPIPIASATLPPPPQNGSPDPVLPPPAEKPVVAPNPAPIPSDVLLSDEQLVRFTAYAYRQGMSEVGLVRYLKTKGINSPSQIPLSKARMLWNELQEPLITQQFK